MYTGILTTSKFVKRTINLKQLIVCHCHFLRRTALNLFFFVPDHNDIVRFDTQAYGKTGGIVMNKCKRRVKYIDFVSDLNGLQGVSFVIWSGNTKFDFNELKSIFRYRGI